MNEAIKERQLIAAKALLGNEDVSELEVWLTEKLRAIARGNEAVQRLSPSAAFRLRYEEAREIIDHIVEETR